MKLVIVQEWMRRLGGQVGDHGSSNMACRF